MGEHTTSMIKAIIFDFAGVIVHEGYWDWLAKKVPDLAGKEKFFLDLSDRTDSGAISHEKFLEELEKTSRDRYLRMCYAAVVSSPEEVLNNSTDALLKIQGLNKLIVYFEEKEEFEKCSELQNILKMI